MKDLVTVAEFHLSVEAAFARSALESAGIECFLKDENAGRMYGHASVIIGGMRLQVAAADEEAAREILADMERLTDQPPTPE